MKTTIFFDYDGVLVDSISHVADIQTEICKRFGKNFTVTPDLIRRHWGNGWQEFYRNICGFTEGELEETTAHFRELSGSGSFLPPMFHDMKKVCEELSGIYALHVVSGNFSEIISKNLARLGVDHLFGAIVGNNEAGGYPKHDSRFYTTPAHSLGLAHDEIVLLGDTIDEIRGGKAAGITVISCAWGWSSEDRLSAEQPDHLAKDPFELLAILRALRHT